jgi:hypothetical protein
VDQLTSGGQWLSEDIVAPVLTGSQSGRTSEYGAALVPDVFVQGVISAEPGLQGNERSTSGFASFSQGPPARRRTMRAPEVVVLRQELLDLVETGELGRVRHRIFPASIDPGVQTSPDLGYPLDVLVVE